MSASLKRPTWARRKKYPNITETLLDTRPEKAKPGDPNELYDCPKVAEHLAKSCRTLSPRGEHRPKFDQHGLHWATCSPNWANAGQCSTKIVPSRSTWSNLVNFGPDRSNTHGCNGSERRHCRRAASASQPSPPQLRRERMEMPCLQRVVAAAPPPRASLGGCREHTSVSGGSVGGAAGWRSAPRQGAPEPLPGAPWGPTERPGAAEQAGGQRPEGVGPRAAGVARSHGAQALSARARALRKRGSTSPTTMALERYQCVRARRFPAQTASALRAGVYKPGEPLRHGSARGCPPWWRWGADGGHARGRGGASRRVLLSARDLAERWEECRAPSPPARASARPTPRSVDLHLEAHRPQLLDLLLHLTRACARARARCCTTRPTVMNETPLAAGPHVDPGPNVALRHPNLRVDKGKCSRPPRISANRNVEQVAQVDLLSVTLFRRIR